MPSPSPSIAIQLPNPRNIRPSPNARKGSHSPMRPTLRLQLRLEILGPPLQHDYLRLEAPPSVLHVSHPARQRRNLVVELGSPGLELAHRLSHGASLSGNDFRRA